MTGIRMKLEGVSAKADISAESTLGDAPVRVGSKARNFKGIYQSYHCKVCHQHCEHTVIRNVTIDSQTS